MVVDAFELSECREIESVTDRCEKDCESPPGSREGGRRVVGSSFDGCLRKSFDGCRCCRTLIRQRWNGAT